MTHLLLNSFGRHRGPPFSRQRFPVHFLKRISIHFNRDSLGFVPEGSIGNILALAQVVAWRHSGDRPVSETMMGRLLKNFNNKTCLATFKISYVAMNLMATLAIADMQLENKILHDYKLNIYMYHI